MSSLITPSGRAQLQALQWTPIAATFLALVAVWGFWRLLNGKQKYLSTIPVIGTEAGSAAQQRVAFASNAKKLIEEGYRKFKKSCFRLNTMNADVIVLDPRFLAELKDVPGHIISRPAAIEESMQARFTGLSDSPHVPNLIKRDLTPALKRLYLPLAEEVDQCFLDELPPGELNAFTPVNFYQKLIRIVSVVSGRVFVGPELCRTEKYIEMASNYTEDVVNARQAVTEMPRWQRPFKATSLPAVKALREREKSALLILKPLIESRVKAVNDPDYQKPDDLLQWVLDMPAKLSQQEIAEMQLLLTFAAIHTTTMTTASIFHTLAAKPELIPELREEISSVLRQHGGFTAGALVDMKKLDSFFNENARYYPNTYTSFERKVLQDFTLSTKQVIPAGVSIEVASHPLSFDAEVVPDPETFDALRSYKLRTMQGAEKGGANQFVTTSPSNLTWGYGRHACPGRFFAATEAKMIVSRAILDYDISNADGYKGRYPNVDFGPMSMPDPSRKLLFKRRAI